MAARLLLLVLLAPAPLAAAQTLEGCRGPACVQEFSWGDECGTGGDGGTFAGAADAGVHGYEDCSGGARVVKVGGSAPLGEAGSARFAWQERTGFASGNGRSVEVAASGHEARWESSPECSLRATLRVPRTTSFSADPPCVAAPPAPPSLPWGRLVP